VVVAAASSSATSTAASTSALFAPWPAVGDMACAASPRAAHETGVVLRVVASTQVTLRPLQVTSMTDQLAVYASRAEALAGGAEPSARIG
jgi:hypothetical protein